MTYADVDLILLMRVQCHRGRRGKLGASRSRVCGCVEAWFFVGLRVRMLASSSAQAGEVGCFVSVVWVFDVRWAVLLIGRRGSPLNGLGDVEHNKRFVRFG
jgi:hypothetical protein